MANILSNIFKKGSLFKGDKVVWMIYFLLCMISIAEIYSASSNLTFGSGKHWEPLVAQIGFLGMGFFLVLITHRIPCKFFKLIPIPGYLIVLFLLIYVSLFTGAVNSAARWIPIGPVHVQPSELAKGVLITTVATILSYVQMEFKIKGKPVVLAIRPFLKKANRINLKKHKQGDKEAYWDNMPTSRRELMKMPGRYDAFGTIMVLSGIYCLLIFTENFSTATIIFIVIFGMMYIGNIPREIIMRMVALGLFVAVIGTTTLILIPEKSMPQKGRAITWKHRIERILLPSDKKEKKMTDEFRQEYNSAIAIANSNVIGMGVGNSMERDFLAHAESDFIYSIIVEEAGVFGGCLVIFLYIALLVRTGRIAQRCDRFFPAFLVLGLGMMITLQALTNISVAVGIFPVTGQPLPLISKGGSSILTTSVYIGMILSVSRYADKVSETAEEPAEQASTNETSEYFDNKGMD